MKDNIGRILVSEQALREKIEELGKRITEDYQGKDLLLSLIHIFRRSSSGAARKTQHAEAKTTSSVLNICGV